MITRLQTNKRWSQQKHGQILNTQSSSSQITKDIQSPISTIATFTNFVRNPSEYSDCSAGNGNNAHLRFSVTNHSINSYDTIRSTRFISLQNSNTDKFKRLKLAIVIIVVLVLAGISAAVTVLVLRNKPGATYITPVYDNYTGEMSNTSCEVLQMFNDSFCSNLTDTLLKNTRGVRCQVNSLSSGSILVNCSVHVITDSIMNILQSASPCENVEVNQTNINISIGNTDNFADEFPDQMDKFICSSETEGMFLPLNTTYPDNCSAFQICQNGVGTRVICDDSFHFAITGSIVCISQNSTSTYCNKHTIKDSIVTPSQGSILTPTQQSTTTTQQSTTTTQQATAIYSATYFTGENCTSINGDKNYSSNTYPYKCDQFLWCDNGKLFVSHCAAGTYFTLDPRNVCDHCYKPNTYCQSRKGNDSVDLTPLCNQ